MRGLKRPRLRTCQHRWSFAGEVDRVAKKQEYLNRLQAVIQELYKCRADHRRSVSVHEVLGDKTTWEGEVEIFWLTGHPGAKRCYAWASREGDSDTREHIAAILEIPPVIGPATAVRAALAAKAKRGP